MENYASQFLSSSCAAPVTYQANCTAHIRPTGPIPTWFYSQTVYQRTRTPGRSTTLSAVITEIVKGKGMFLIQRSILSVGPLKALYTFCPPRQTCSFRHQLGFSGKHSSHGAITRNDKSLTFPSLSKARYSFIQLSQLGRQWRERKCPIFETVAKGFRTRAHFIVRRAFYQ